MAIISFIISLAGATMLLLFAVRMVRTGIERSLGASFQRVLTQNKSLVGSSISGVMLAVFLQSSAAVTLLATGFAANGYLAFPVGLAIVLGGDLGSALIIQVLSFEVEWLVPVLLAIGGWLFVKNENRKGKQLGRILMGVAFILISLQFLREAVLPIRDGDFLPAISDYLSRDFATAFIVGAAFAFVMHSSVATILMCVTLLQIGAIPFPVALSLLLGANLGSALIPIWLTRGMPIDARRIPFANLGLRGAGAVLVLIFVNLAIDPASLMVANAGQSLIYAHIGFNLIVLVVALPFCSLLEKPMIMLMPASLSANLDPYAAGTVSVLDRGALGNPTHSIANLKRELLRMTDLVDRMLCRVPELYESGGRDLTKELRVQDRVLNDALSGIRTYVADTQSDQFKKPDLKIVWGLMDYAIRLETAGDVVAQKLTMIAREKNSAKAKFSKEGWGELVSLHEAVRANLKLACNVLISDDLESARLLVVEKAEIKRVERKSRKLHLSRLQDGREESFETSDAHLETLRALRDINNHISAIAYPILYRNGQLLETRLIENLDGDGIND
jgi:phosphate:Na+ symporter